MEEHAFNISEGIFLHIVIPCLKQGEETVYENRLFWPTRPSLIETVKCLQFDMSIFKEGDYVIGSLKSLRCHDVLLLSSPRSLSPGYKINLWTNPVPPWAPNFIQRTSYKDVVPLEKFPKSKSPIGIPAPREIFPKRDFHIIFIYFLFPYRKLSDNYFFICQYFFVVFFQHIIDKRL